jgi:hypothetical protein
MFIGKIPNLITHSQRHHVGLIEKQVAINAGPQMI